MGGHPCGSRWICDHIIARKDGGADELWNLRTLCTACDARRHIDKAVAGGERW
jgi:5-methylcytosine-specific restriction endonuclease McrA